MLSLLAICLLPLLRVSAGLIKRSPLVTPRPLNTIYTPLDSPSVTPIPLNVSYNPPNANCVDYVIPVSVSTPGLEFVATKWTNDLELMDFISAASTRTTANFSSPLTGPVHLEGNYTVSATFCSPKTKTNASSTVLLLTHGGGYDGRYWNSAFEPETYNFVQCALSQGYSTFNYDRVGSGKSSKLSGYVAQAAIHIDVLGELATKIRSGQYTDDIGVPAKLALIGHSMGSGFTNGLVVKAPKIADAVVLTGLALAQDTLALETFNARIASQQSSIWSESDSGWSTWGSIYNNVNAFFKAPLYDFEALKYAESVKAPSGLVEMLSLPTIELNATQFKGPALVINGEYDFLVCGGYCPGVIEANALNFVNSIDFKAVVVPGAGHGLNFHTNAPQAYATIIDFLRGNGI